MHELVFYNYQYIPPRQNTVCRVTKKYIYAFHLVKTVNNKNKFIDFSFHSGDFAHIFHMNITPSQNYDYRNIIIVV